MNNGVWKYDDIKDFSPLVAAAYAAEIVKPLLAVDLTVEELTRDIVEMIEGTRRYLATAENDYTYELSRFGVTVAAEKNESGTVEVNVYLNIASLYDYEPAQLHTSPSGAQEEATVAQTYGSGDMFPDSFIAYAGDQIAAERAAVQA